MKIIFIVIILCITFSLLGQTKSDTKITAERFYNYNGVGWVPDHIDDYVFDGSENITNMLRYLYDSEGNTTGIEDWDCEYFDDHYTISRSYSYYHDAGLSSYGYTKTWTYTYNLDGLKTGYYYDYEFQYVQEMPHTIDHSFEYTYDNNILTDIDEVYTEDNQGLWTTYNYHTDLVYDTGRIITENKTSLVDDEWVDLESTIWTYQDNIGTGITEEFIDSVWVNKSKKIRDLNESNKPVTEERFIWDTVGGSWDKDEIDYNYYNALHPEGDVLLKYPNLTHTLKYDSETETYGWYKYHEILYEVGDLSSPSNITSSTQSNSLTLAWEEVIGATGYKIYSSNEPCGTFVIDSTGTFIGTTWTTNLTDQKKFYKISAVKQLK